jgi:hypothetical protein
MMCLEELLRKYISKVNHSQFQWIGTDWPVEPTSLRSTAEGNSKQKKLLLVNNKVKSLEFSGLFFLKKGWDFEKSKRPEPAAFFCHTIIENETDLPYIKSLLGHSSSKQPKPTHRSAPKGRKK